MFKKSIIPIEVRRWLFYVAILSFFINFLLLASPIYMLQIYDRVLVSRSLPTLGTITLITVILVLAYGALDMFRGRVLLRAGLILERELGCKGLDRLHNFGPQKTRGINRAEAIRDVTTLRNYLSSQHLVSIFDVPWVPLFTLLIFSFSWVLGVITLAGMAVLVILALMDEKFTFRAYTEANLQVQRAAQFAHNSVGNAEIVHALGMKHRMINIWLDLLNIGSARLKQAADSGSVISSMTKTIRILIQIGMLGMGAYLVIIENLPPGVMIASTIIVARAIGPVEGIISGWRVFVEARNSYARVAELLQESESVNMQRVELPKPKGDIVAENIYFGFGGGKPLLSNVSFKISAGEAIGIIGPSGSGKSSLVRVLLGVLKPVQGRVLLDGYDINQYRREALGKFLGYHTQNVELFPSSVAQNICRMEEPEACAENILRAAELVGLKEIIGRLPDGFDTILADQGLNLSGGQRQLVGLARAFFGSPNIVVLDEPDASLDQQATQRLLEVIEQVRRERGMTLLVVSHNPRVIERMDRLLLVKDGTVNFLERKTESPATGYKTPMSGVRIASDVA
jgi:ATP-binding cassette subfamily C protein EexD